MQQLNPCCAPRASFQQSDVQVLASHTINSAKCVYTCHGWPSWIDACYCQALYAAASSLRYKCTHMFTGRLHCYIPPVHASGCSQNNSTASVKPIGRAHWEGACACTCGPVTLDNIICACWLWRRHETAHKLLHSMLIAGMNFAEHTHKCTPVRTASRRA